MVNVKDMVCLSTLTSLAMKLRLRLRSLQEASNAAPQLSLD